MANWRAGHRQGGAGEGGEAGAVCVQDLLLRAGPQHHQGQERREGMGRRHGRPLPHLEGDPRPLPSFFQKISSKCWKTWTTVQSAKSTEGCCRALKALPARLSGHAFIISLLPVSPRACNAQAYEACAGTASAMRISVQDDTMCMHAVLVLPEHAPCISLKHPEYSGA